MGRKLLQQKNNVYSISLAGFIKMWIRKDLIWSRNHGTFLQGEFPGLFLYKLWLWIQLSKHDFFWVALAWCYFECDKALLRFDIHVVRAIRFARGWTCPNSTLSEKLNVNPVQIMRKKFGKIHVFVKIPWLIKKQRVSKNFQKCRNVWNW